METEKSDSVYYLAVASIWLPEKGLSDLASMAKMLYSDEQLVIVGKLTKKQRASLPNGVVTIERTDNINTLVKLYSRATALVNPTWQDNYPTVNLEAISCGTPVVTYRTGGSIESIVPETGFIVEQGDIEGLAFSLHSIRQQSREKWRQSCRDYALRHFDKQAVFKEYIDLYESCASSTT